MQFHIRTIQVVNTCIYKPWENCQDFPAPSQHSCLQPVSVFHLVFYFPSKLLRTTQTCFLETQILHYKLCLHGKHSKMRYAQGVAVQEDIR